MLQNDHIKQIFLYEFRKYKYTNSTRILKKKTISDNQIKLFPNFSDVTNISTFCFREFACCTDGAQADHVYHDAVFYFMCVICLVIIKTSNHSLT